MVDKAMEEFYQSQLDVDKFLSDAMEREELKDIQRQLIEMKLKNSTKMSEVLRLQTDAVLGIAEKLQNLYKMIDNLNSPLLQLKEEVRSIQLCVSKAATLYDHYTDLQRSMQSDWVLTSIIGAFNKVQEHLHKFLSRYIGNISPESEKLERVICKFAFQVQVMDNANMEVSPHTEEVEVTLSKLLVSKFKMGYEKLLVNDLRRTIDLYLFLQKDLELIEVIKSEVVKPAIASIVNEEYLNSVNGNLMLLYLDAFKVLGDNLKILFHIFKYDQITKFDIFVDCYWAVLDEHLRENLNSITAAGHPDQFYKNFIDTLKFFDLMVDFHENKNIIRENESFINHLKRFNLAVYYEIRHQVVTGGFETAILKHSNFDEDFFVANPGDYQNFQLKVSVYLKVHIQYILHDIIFLPILSDQFLKSTMLLISRYLTWVDTILLDLESKDNAMQKQVLIYLLADIRNLKSEFGFKVKNASQIDNSAFAVVDISARTQLREVLKIENIRFNQVHDKVKNRLVRTIVNESMECLKNVGSIPRLYRRTNKNAPSTHSNYVTEAVYFTAYLSTYFLGNDPILVESQRCIFDEIIKTVADNYFALISDVLKSVSKTEESLRRLKSRSAPVQDDNRGSSDEEKIRMQIKLDVAHFYNELRQHSASNGKKALDALFKESGN